MGRMTALEEYNFNRRRVKRQKTLPVVSEAELEATRRIGLIRDTLMYWRPKKDSDGSELIRDMALRLATEIYWIAKGEK